MSKHLTLLVLSFLLIATAFITPDRSLAQNQELNGFGTFGVWLKPTNSEIETDRNGLLYWIAFGDWEAERIAGGINSPNDIAFRATVNKKTKTVLYQGSVNGTLRHFNGFTPVGNIHGEFTITVTNINFDIDPITGREIFAIGRKARALASIVLTSPDKSVHFGQGANDHKLVLNFVEKFLQPPGSPSSRDKYGNFADNPFSFYIGPRHVPGDLFYTGTYNTGTSSWLMATADQPNVFINGIEFIPPGADLHGDLVEPSGPCTDFGYGPDVLPDICGVCGGDGTSCLDCLGVPFGSALLDKCGVCNGDGTSCEPDCTETDIFQSQLQIDGNGDLLKKLVRRASRKLRKLETSRARRIARDANASAQNLYNQLWNQIWSLPNVVLNCSNSALCIQSDNLITINAVSISSANLLDLLTGTVRSLQRLSNSPRVGRRLVRRGIRTDDETTLLLAEVPSTSSSCDL